MEDDTTPQPDPWRAWLGRRARRRLLLPDYRQAAVLVALTREPETRVVLTVRSEDMPTHKGQVSFPGGRIEPGETPVEAALREAWEEVGLEREVVEVIGELDDAFTPVGFHVTPVLARIPADYPFLPSSEVASVVLPSLRELRELTPVREVRELPGGERRVLYRYLWAGHDVWGMTARILHDVVRSGIDG